MDNLFTELAAFLWQIVQPVAAALSPLFIGLVLAWLLDPVVEWLRPKLGGVWSILLTYLTLAAAAAAMVATFIILILGAFPTGDWQETGNLIISYFTDSYTAAAGFLSKYLPTRLMDAEDAADWLTDWISSRFSIPLITEMLENLYTGLVNLFLGVIISIYLLKDRSLFIRLWNQFLSLILKQKTHGQLSETMGEIGEVLKTFVKGALVDSLLVAFLSSIALSLLDVDFAVVIGIFGGLLNIIPYFGPFFGMAAAFLVALLGSGLPKAALAALALFLVQQADCNFIYPRIVGEATGLHPLFVLLSVSVFGSFFGIVGMILAVPMAGVLQIFVRKWAYR